MRGDYDYHHATTNTQFLAILIVMLVLACFLGGLVMFTTIL